MKRSEINQIIRNADTYLKKMNFYLQKKYLICQGCLKNGLVLSEIKIEEVWMR